MSRQAKRSYCPPLPSQSMWVPFPGSKRKAEEMIDTELSSSSPAKMCALEKEIGELVLQKELLKRSDNGVAAVKCVPTERNCLVSADEEMEFDEMEDLEEADSESPTFYGTGAPLSINDEMSDEGDGDGCVMDLEHVHASGVENSVINSPKLYLFEGLREALSSRPCDDLFLQHALRDNSPTRRMQNSMAMVLWKPPDPSLLLPSDKPTYANDIGSEAIQDPSLGDKCTNTMDEDDCEQM